MSLLDRIVGRVRRTHQIAVDEELGNKHKSAEQTIDGMSNMEFLELLSEAMEPDEGEA